MTCIIVRDCIPIEITGDIISRENDRWEQVFGVSHPRRQRGFDSKAVICFVGHGRVVAVLEHGILIQGIFQAVKIDVGVVRPHCEPDHDTNSKSHNASRYHDETPYDAFCLMSFASAAVTGDILEN